MRMTSDGPTSVEESLTALGERLEQYRAEDTPTELRAPLEHLRTTRIPEVGQSWAQATQAGDMPRARQVLHEFRLEATRILPYDDADAHQILEQLDIHLTSITVNMTSPLPAELLSGIRTLNDLVQTFGPKADLSTAPRTDSPIPFDDVEKVLAASSPDHLAAQSPQQRIDHIVGVNRFVLKLKKSAAEKENARKISGVTDPMRTTGTTPPAQPDFIRAIATSWMALTTTIQTKLDGGG